jgi:hypothetical protein
MPEVKDSANKRHVSVCGGRKVKEDGGAHVKSPEQDAITLFAVGWKRRRVTCRRRNEVRFFFVKGVYGIYGKDNLEASPHNLPSCPFHLCAASLFPSPHVSSPLSLLPGTPSFGARSS